MTDFSSVNLRILSPDGKTVLAELQTIDRVGQRTARRIGETNKAIFTDVDRHIGSTAQKVAGTFSLIAASGQTSAGALKGLVTEGASLAAMFGLGGPIVAAMSLTGLTMFNLFSRTQEEIRKTNRVALEELEKLARAGNIGSVAGRMQELFSGQRYAVQGENESDVAFQARQLGVQGVRAKIAEISKRFEKFQNMPGALGQSGRETAKMQLKPWQDELEKLVTQHERLSKLLDELSAKEGAMAQSRVAELRTAYDERTAKTSLFDRSAIPDPSLTGSPMSGFNQVEFDDKVHKGILEKLRNVPPVPPGEMTEELERIMAMDEAAERAGKAITNTLADSIGDGIAEAARSGSIADGFKALGGSVLRGMGSILQTIGTQALIGMKLFDKMMKWMFSNPALGIPAAIALIAFGGLLQGMGAGMGGGGSGGFSSSGFGSGGGGSESRSIIDRGLINPLNPLTSGLPSVAARPNLPPIIVIGEDDARAQRTIYRMWEKARLRSEG